MLFKYYKTKLRLIDAEQISRAIYLATDLGCIETVKFLVENAGFGFVESKSIMLAVEKGDTPLFELFFQNNKDIANKIYKEKTLLEIAARNGHIDIVRLLIKEMNIQDVYYEKTKVKTLGFTSVHLVNVIEYAILLAAKNGHNEIVDLLEKTKKSEK